MKAKESNNNMTRAEKMGTLYTEVQHWQSNLGFIEGERTFINHLLHSYTFEPHTPESFKILQDYRNRIMITKKTENKIVEKIVKHKARIGGVLECSDQSYDASFRAKHTKIKVEFEQFKEDFQILKAEIFEYAIKIMKKRKPSS
ncbi:hypothetical protein [Pareuzebyella sediminis]|uniref:hypothetical protein n=1 Tax=Pareuzebyella sediminis TaxID=2607998 RepID=UPI0011EDE962|nr:hypothetical protein [Pareuzebyella sediminis]